MIYSIFCKKYNPIIIVKEDFPMMHYRVVNDNGKTYVECRNDEKINWFKCAGFDEASSLIFYGDYSEKVCKEIENFLKSQCIHIDEKGRAYFLLN